MIGKVGGVQGRAAGAYEGPTGLLKYGAGGDEGKAEVVPQSNCRSQFCVWWLAGPVWRRWQGHGGCGLTRGMRGLLEPGLMGLSSKSHTQYSLPVMRFMRRRTPGEECLKPTEKRGKIG